MALDQATVEALDQAIEIDMRTPRRDGSMSARPIWVVVVDGDPYVRSYHAERGAWYRRARAEGRAAIGFDGQTLDVGLEPAPDEDVNQRVSDAFRSKYGRRSPRSTDAMVTPEVTATTLRLTPAA